MEGRFISRMLFRSLNQLIIVPAFKIGLGRLISNQLTGHIMVLKTLGRRTGKSRYTPVSYAVINGVIYCYQGRRLKGQWYLNLLKDPTVEVLLPDRSFEGRAEVVVDPVIRVAAMRHILTSSGLGGLVYGFNPHTVQDDSIREKTIGIHVIRITPKGSKGDRIG
jgi:hypothetical protein